MIKVMRLMHISSALIDVAEMIASTRRGGIVMTIRHMICDPLPVFKSKTDWEVAHL